MNVAWKSGQWAGPSRYGFIPGNGLAIELPPAADRAVLSRPPHSIRLRPPLHRCRPPRYIDLAPSPRSQPMDFTRPATRDELARALIEAIREAGETADIDYEESTGTIRGTGKEKQILSLTKIFAEY